MNFIYFTSNAQKARQIYRCILKGTEFGILWSFMVKKTIVPRKKAPIMDGGPLSCHMPVLGIKPGLQQWHARYIPLCYPSLFDYSGPKVIKHFSCSTQLSKKIVLPINLRLLAITNSFLLHITKHENFSVNKYENANSCRHFHIY